MAAYIDLNAVRAGLVEDPKDYRFCGYAEAVVGHRRAREDGVLSKAAALRCRVRYFTDGLILGSDAFVRKFAGSRKGASDGEADRKLFPLKGAEWGDLAVPIRLRRKVFH